MMEKCALNTDNCQSHQKVLNLAQSLSDLPKKAKVVMATSSGVKLQQLIKNAQSVRELLKLSRKLK
jgi:hypothetical protein